MIQQRGYFDVRMDFDDSTGGEIRVSVEDPMDVIPDPDAKHYAPASWSDVIKTSWQSLDEIEGEYGKKREQPQKAQDYQVEKLILAKLETLTVVKSEQNSH